MSPLLEVLGRCHPLLLHLPIGLVIGLLALEVLSRLRRRALPDDVVAVLLWLAALSSLLVAGSGWLLGSSGDYSGDTLFYHRWLGVSVAAVVLLTALAQRAGARRLYGGLLIAGTLLLVLAGHFGSTLTHGAGFLTEPLRRVERRAPVELPVAVAEDSGPTWSRDIAPILAGNCTSCHGAKKRKGGLALHTPAALLKGAKQGPVLVPGDPGQSQLILRVELPLDDMDHMPPEGKPQPSAQELEVLRAWVAAGAPFDVSTQAPEGEQPEQDVELEDETAAAPAVLPPALPDALALAALQTELVHVESLSGSASGLWIDFAATAEQIDDAAARRLLAPLGEHVQEISLARTRVADETARLLAGFPALRRLDLRSTAVTDAGVESLVAATALEELVLAQTAVGDGAIASLLSMPALRQVWLWKSALSAEGLARLRRERPDLRVDDGAAPDAAVLEAEGELDFTSDRSLPGSDAQPDRSLAPVNTLCPVSGDPVNPSFAVVHDGRVIGFCCPNCPKQFWADPEKFAVKLQ